MLQEILQDAEHRMKGAVNALDGDLASFRTGRASPRILDRLVVEMYGTEMKLIEMASVSVPEPQSLAIRPYDASSIPAIERAILMSDLGLNANSDGKNIYLNIPPLTEERRRDLTRMVSRRVEEAKVAVRNVRRDALNDIREMQNEKMISEDESYRGQESLQDVTDKYVKIIDEVGEAKNKEIMEV